MALAFVSSTGSALTATATAVPVPYPASITLGDPLVLLVGTKPFNGVITTPDGWIPLGQITNGSTAAGTDTTVGSAWSVAFGSNPGLTAGDEVALAGVIATDIASNTWTAPGLTATGATITTPTVRQSAFISTGFDSGGCVMTAPVTAGPSSGNPTWTATCGQGTNNSGSAVLVRIREVPKPSARSPLVVQKGAGDKSYRW